MQTWSADINASTKSSFYKIIKHDFCFEEYLDILPFKSRITLTKFRVTNHALPIEVGRWENTERENRHCPFCAGNVLGDEFHYLFECHQFQTDRTKYIKNYYHRHPNVLKTQSLFNCNNKPSLQNLSTFISNITSKFR